MSPLHPVRKHRAAILAAALGATLLGGCSDTVYRQQVGVDVWGNTVPMPVWTRKGGVASDKDCLALQTAPAEPPKCGSLSYAESDGGAIVSDILKGLGVAVSAADAAAIWKEANAISREARSESASQRARIGAGDDRSGGVNPDQHQHDGYRRQYALK